MKQMAYLDRLVANKVSQKEAKQRCEMKRALRQIGCQDGQDFETYSETELLRELCKRYGVYVGEGDK